MKSRIETDGVTLVLRQAKWLRLLTIFDVAAGAFVVVGGVALAIDRDWAVSITLIVVGSGLILVMAPLGRSRVECSAAGLRYVMFRETTIPSADIEALVEIPVSGVGDVRRSLISVSLHSGKTIKLAPSTFVGSHDGVDPVPSIIEQMRVALQVHA